MSKLEALGLNCMLFIVLFPRVIDLGVMCPCEKILQTAMAEKAGVFSLL